VETDACTGNTGNVKHSSCDGEGACSLWRRDRERLLPRILA
jgi:hypothetical protein